VTLRTDRKVTEQVRYAQVLKDKKPLWGCGYTFSRAQFVPDGSPVADRHSVSALVYHDFHMSCIG
jgi:hypothetical protein